MRQLTQRAAARAAILALASAALLAGLTGCDGGHTDSAGKDQAPGAASADSIRVTPRDGAKDVGRFDRIRVTVPEGRLERVTVQQIEAADPVDLPGQVSADGRSWTPLPGAHPALAAKYGVDAVTVDDSGRRAARHTTFTTTVPAHRFIGYFTPENRATVGTGMIVSIDFNRRIKDRAAVQRAISVTSDPAVDIAGHWFGDRRLDFRPRSYWKPGTKVTLGLHLRDVQAAPGVYGTQQKTVAFTIGRSQVSTVDAAAHTMKVRGEGGRLLATLPVTTGAPDRTTYNGEMVISQMYDVTRMNGSTVGFGGEYDIKDVPHAMRLTRSGTFIHGNYWASADTFGSRNTSHGCIGLRDVKGGSSSTPAGWFFDSSLIGDVVKVVNSDDRTVAPDNGLSGWNMDWAAWRKGSAR
ncbi:L,D-transpeptidase [Streptomyces montanisoli]|uniref:L,D-transpeptidase family protein n=1 Tax=Streptomyces montanisoli TaxID=2798581 RepID=A0A940RTK6_9ACTN|nr:Ig-like domain-containing protein [Streptomyces montanisoli]MBP0456982.1 L,D-transpeptidase family protein [Streptomyces montanisoli]